MEQKHYECPQCSSTDIDLISEDYGICKSCGTKVYFKQQTTPNQIVKNNVYVIQKGNGSSIENSNWVIKSENTSQEFFRQALIDLAIKRSTPEDIFDSKFNPVKKDYKQMLCVKADVSLNCGASIGYNRTEEYYDYQKEWDPQLQRQVEKKVKKTRTVTDWSPTSGKFDQTECGFVFNSDEEQVYFDDCDRFENAFDNMKSDSSYEVENVDFETEYPKDACSKAVEIAKARCVVNAVKECENTLPGDEYKDFTYSDTCKVKKIFCIVAPEYSLDYSYKDKKYTKRAFAFGGMRMTNNDINAQKDTNKVIRKKTLPLLLIGTILSVLSIVLSLIVKSIPIICAIFAVAIIVDILAEIIYHIVEKNVKTKKQQIKIERLKDLLKKNGLKSLSESEIEQIKE